MDRDGTTIGLAAFPRPRPRPRVANGRPPLSQIGWCPLGQALVVDSEKPLAEAAIELMQTEPGRALVMEHGRLHGLLSITDIARWLEILRRP